MTKNIDFQSVESRAGDFADFLDRNSTTVLRALNLFETLEVAHDELERTTEVLRCLSENQQYFHQRIARSASLLPCNLPMYSLALFGVIPSYMSAETQVRPPAVQRDVIKQLSEAMNLGFYCPNLSIDNGSHAEFLQRHTGNQSATEGTRLSTEAIIFTGTPERALELRKKFNSRVLFLMNGSGHNPIVVTQSADVERAAHSALRTRVVSNYRQSR